MYERISQKDFKKKRLDKIHELYKKEIEKFS